MEFANAGITYALDEDMAAVSALSARILHTVADIDQRELWQADGATSMSSWLAARYGLAWGTAREWVRVSRALSPGFR